MMKNSQTHEQKWLKSNILYTDGACSGNPGKGGWAAVIATLDGQVSELGGGGEFVTNNQMELLAVIKGLEKLRSIDGQIVVFTDSTYVIRGITQWIWGWKKRNWVNAEGQAVQNRDLWEQLHSLVLKKSKDEIEWQYVRGHQGNPGNERCDEIAVAFSQKKYIQLYKGPLVGYSIAIHDFPEKVELPEMKPKTEKTKAFSYLSLLGGKVLRHKDWSSCERRVKGQSGAKFKKATSSENEKEILTSWGLSPQASIQDTD